MKTVYIPIKASEEMPAEDRDFRVSGIVCVILKNGHHHSSYTLKGEWQTVPESNPVEYWLKKVEIPSEEEIDDFADVESDGYYGKFANGVEYGIPKGAQFVLNKLT